MRLPARTLLAFTCGVMMQCLPPPSAGRADDASIAPAVSGQPSTPVAAKAPGGAPPDLRGAAGGNKTASTAPGSTSAASPLADWLLLVCGVAICMVIARRKAAAGDLAFGAPDSPIGPNGRSSQATPHPYARAPTQVRNR